MKRKTIGILLISILALGLVIWTACDSSKPKSFSGGPRESLSIGTVPIVHSALIWIAKGKGYFAEQGLDINIKQYESGHLAIQDLLAGALDLATASEFGTVRLGVQRNGCRIISILDEADDQHLIARKDRGITKPSDLRNKRIGLARASSAEYYLHLMLILEKIPIQDVHMVDLWPSEHVKAITAGDVDAIMTWEPFASIATKELGTNAARWSAQSGEAEYWLLLGTEVTLKQRSSAVRRFLAALASAEHLIKKNVAEAVRILSEQLVDQHIASWPQNHKFRLGLHRPLILKMETELRWMNSKAGTGKFEMPDLLDFIYPDALSSVKPEGVTILIGKRE